MVCGSLRTRYLGFLLGLVRSSIGVDETGVPYEQSE